MSVIEGLLKDLREIRRQSGGRKPQQAPQKLTPLSVTLAGVPLWSPDGELPREELDRRLRVALAKHQEEKATRNGLGSTTGSADAGAMSETWAQRVEQGRHEADDEEDLRSSVLDGRSAKLAAEVREGAIRKALERVRYVNRVAGRIAAGVVVLVGGLSVFFMIQGAPAREAEAKVLKACDERLERGAQRPGLLTYLKEKDVCRLAGRVTVARLASTPAGSLAWEATFDSCLLLATDMSKGAKTRPKTVPRFSAVPAHYAQDHVRACSEFADDVAGRVSILPK